eukprot:1183259-Prorocentrum_minimum.AAC.2
MARIKTSATHVRHSCPPFMSAIHVRHSCPPAGPKRSTSPLALVIFGSRFSKASHAGYDEMPFSFVL